MAETEREVVNAIRSIRELFHGRFTDADIAFLYDFNDRDKINTVMYILQTDPEEVTQLLQDERKAWQIIKRKKQSVPQNVLEKAKSGTIKTTSRQFACRPCDHSWWKNVPERKMVSKCKFCHVKFDPIPKDKEWGWAEFHCTYCRHEFGGFCQMGTPSPCYHCHQMVLPTRILPPNGNRQRRTNSRHSCAACRGRGGISMHDGGGISGHGSGGISMNGRGGISRHGGGGITMHGTGGICAHPSTRRANHLSKVLYSSQPHDSTGSTVDTFLPQDNLTQGYYEVLPGIPEESGSDEGNAGSDDG